MKQLIQHVDTGKTAVVDVPVPQVLAGHILVQVANSLVSTGTERMVVDFAQKNLVAKARARPDLVKQTLTKASREGLLTTVNAVRNRLEQPMALGYSCAGTVVEVGVGVTSFAAGDRVACGGGSASHAEIVVVPKNLAVKIPAEVKFEAAAFATIGAIALQGLRLADISLGEVVAVIGLGLLGQLTVQMAKAAGCTVIGMDLQPERALLAEEMGADVATTSAKQFAGYCARFSSGFGADAVVITAATDSNQPVQLAGEVARKRGIVVAVGAVGTTIPRKVYYEKELDFRISTSYGPGRYDPEYEEKGHDYPYAYVRWTEQRNMEAFVDLAAKQAVDVSPLISHRYGIEEAVQAYQLITGQEADNSFMGVLLTYPEQPSMASTIMVHSPPSELLATGEPSAINRLKLGILGAGNYANATLLPILKDLPELELVGLSSSRGISARAAADRFGFAYCTTDNQRLLEDENINSVAVLTRHHLHAQQTVAALKAGKHVFVEKPLCLTEDELALIIATYNDTRVASVDPPQLLVGFNRRFAPFIVELKAYLEPIVEPLALHYRVNAGYIPPDHWAQDPAQGGGRLIGEGIHFIDLLSFLVDGEPEEVVTFALPDSGRYQKDNFDIVLRFSDGSVGTITYVANGSKSFGKEYLEVFGGGLAARIDDYRTLLIQSDRATVKRKAWLKKDKGHRAEWEAWSKYLQGHGPRPIDFDDIVTSMRATFAAQRSLEESELVTIAHSFSGDGRS